MGLRYLAAVSAFAQLIQEALRLSFGELDVVNLTGAAGMHEPMNSDFTRFGAQVRVWGLQGTANLEAEDNLYEELRS